MSRTTLAYLSHDAPGSIRRDGTLSIEPDADVDRTISGVEVQEVATEVRDARDARGSAALQVARNGFELRHDPTPAIDFLDHAAVVEQYLPHCEELVLDAVGGRQAIAFDYNIRAAERSERGRVLGDLRFVHGPARVVHADFTLDGSRQWIRDLVSGAAPTTVAADERAPVDVAGLGALLDGSMPWRFVTIWRNRSDEPVRDNALAMCDGSSVRAPISPHARSTTPTGSARPTSPDRPLPTSGGGTRSSTGTRCSSSNSGTPPGCSPGRMAPSRTPTATVRRPSACTPRSTPSARTSGTSARVSMFDA